MTTGAGTISVVGKQSYSPARRRLVFSARIFRNYHRLMIYGQESQIRSRIKNAHTLRRERARETYIHPVTVQAYRFTLLANNDTVVLFRNEKIIPIFSFFFFCSVRSSVLVSTHNTYARLSVVRIVLVVIIIIMRVLYEHLRIYSTGRTDDDDATASRFFLAFRPADSKTSYTRRSS